MLNSVDVDTVEESPVPALEFNLLAVRGLSINLTALSHIKWTIKKLWAIINKKKPCSIPHQSAKVNSICFLYKNHETAKTREQVFLDVF